MVVTSAKRACRSNVGADARRCPAASGGSRGLGSARRKDASHFDENRNARFTVIGGEVAVPAGADVVAVDKCGAREEGMADQVDNLSCDRGRGASSGRGTPRCAVQRTRTRVASAAGRARRRKGGTTTRSGQRQRWTREWGRRRGLAERSGEAARDRLEELARESALEIAKNRCVASVRTKDATGRLGRGGAGRRRF